MPHVLAIEGHWSPPARRQVRRWGTETVDYWVLLISPGLPGYGRYGLEGNYPKRSTQHYGEGAV